ncbi:MAG: hypothetical protein WCY90_01225 [Bacilli bacterium]
MIVTSNARLTISVKAKRNNNTGAIDLTSVVLPICYRDTIAIDLFDSHFMDIVHYANQSLHISEKPIVDVALRKMREKYGYDETFSVKIYKNIPTGHGLGSGASSAMTVIKAVSRLKRLKLSDEEFLEVAKSIGQDVPFFAVNKPALFENTTQNITPFKFNIKTHVLLIIHPTIIEKKEMIERFFDVGESSQKDINKVITAAETGSLRDVGNALVNDFSDIMLQEIPELKSVINELKTLNVEAYGISGASSTIFALSNNRNLLKYIGDKYRKLKYEVVLTQICK